MKAYQILLICLLFGVAVGVTGCPSLGDSTKGAASVSGELRATIESVGPQELRVHLVAGMPALGDAGGDISVSLPGTTPYLSPGDPFLVERSLRVALPPDADLGSARVAVLATDATELVVDKLIQASPPMASWDGEKTIQEWGDGKQIVDGRNVITYEQDAYYPKACLSAMTAGELREWKAVQFSFYPLQYNPVTGVLRVVTAAEISITYSLAGAKSGMAPRDGAMNDVAAGLMDNYEAARAWYPVTQGAKGTTYPYVILTTNSIVSASTMLTDFEVVHELAGRQVLTVTEDGMYADLDGAKAGEGWGGGVGDAAAENLRAWLQDNYANLGIEYVLLIGNPNPGSGDVPMKMAKPFDEEIPTDFYYGELSGTWDSDGDGVWGELGDDYPMGTMDALAEVHVGRIPHYATSVTAVDDILLKTIDYMLAPSNQAWRKKVLLPMEPVDEVTMSHGLGQGILNDHATPNGWTAFRLYDGDYGFSPEQTPCTKSNVVDEWQNGYGVVSWFTHGSSTSASDVFAASSCAELDDSRPAFTFQCSCLNGFPENSGNLGYSLLKRGAVGTVSATREAWYAVGDENWNAPGYAPYLSYVYTGGIIQGTRAGVALSQMRTSAIGEMPISSHVMGNGLMFNLYGDPALRITGDGSGSAMIQRTPRAFEIYLSPGETAAPQTVDLWSVGGEALSYTISESPSAGWISESPTSGTLNGEKTTITLTFNTAGLSLGNYETAVRVTSAGACNSPLQIPVTIHVQRPLAALLDTNGQVWETGGDANWVEDLTTTHDGSDAASTGNLAVNDKTWISTAVTGPGTVSWWWKSQTEDADTLTLYIDGVWAGKLKGQKPWEQYTRFLDEGLHRIQWQFDNKGAAAPGSDKVWLDQFVFTPVTAPYAVAVAATYIGYEAGQLPAPSPLHIWNATQGTLAYTLSLNVDWLRLSATSGTSSGEVDEIFFEAVPELFPPPGPTQQNVTLTLTAPGAANSPLTKTITVALMDDCVSLGEGLDAPELPWRTSGHSFWIGQKFGSYTGGDMVRCGRPPGNKTSELSVVVEGPGTFTFWRQVIIDSGDLSFYIDGELQGSPLTGYLSTLTQEQYELLPGVHELKWVATHTKNDTGTWFQVTLDNVTYEQRLAKIGVDPESLTPACQPGQDAAPTSFEVWNSGNEVLDYSILSNVSWLRVSPSLGSSTGEHDTVTVTYDTSSLDPGIHRGEIRISKLGEASSVRTIPVTLDIGTRAEVTLTPVKDNTLYEDATGSVSNGAGEYIVVGKYSTSKRRGLVKFDLSSIPSTATVGEASLEVDVLGSVHAVEISLFNAEKEWGEGTSNAAGNETVGATRTKYDATWTYSTYSTASWDTAGGDYNFDRPVATRVVGAAGVYTWESASPLVASVQDWVTDPGSNYGWVLASNEKTALTNKQILSRQNGDPARQPKLHVSYYVSAPATAAVPDVVGDLQTAAESAIESAGLAVGTVTRQYNAVVPKNKVISQTPAGGAMAVPGADVNLVVSDGPSHIAVPAVTNLLLVTAESNLVSAGLTVGTKTYRYTTLAAGKVARQTPVAGTIVPPNTPVAMIVSQGSGSVTVPNVVGMTQAAARAAITDVWLAMGTITQQNSTTVAPGIVISQNRHPGSSLTTGTTVNIAVSIGPLTTVVPDLTGLERQPALDAIAAANLQRGDISYGYSATIPAERVMSQTRVPGARVEQGAVLSFVLSRGEQTATVPDVVGQTQSAAGTAIAEAGLIVGSVTEGYSDTVPAGSVARQEPAAGESAVLGSPVDLVISQGVQPLRVTSPNGGELWVRGSRQTLTWASTFTGGLVKIKLFKGGAFHSWISAGAANTGSLGWTVPETLSVASDYTVQIYAASDFSKVDFSDAAFSIINSPLQMTSPNGGERWYPGTKHAITWNTTNPGITSVKLKLYKGRALQGWISGGTENDGSFTWTFPATAPLGNDYTVLIYAATDATLLDYSDAPFSLAAPPITMLNPNGGERFLPGDPLLVTWKSEEGAAANVKVKLFKNNVFHSWICGGTANDGEFAWMLPADLPMGVDYQAQIYSATDFTVVDYSDSMFAISADRLRITSPNYGESWIQGSAHEITWDSDGTVGATVKLKLFKNGVFNRWIHGGTPNDGSLMWTVPVDAEAGSDYRIQIYSATATAIVDFSDGYFSIAEPPLEVTYPNGGEMLTRGTPVTITWNSLPGVGDLVKLKLFKAGVLSRWINGGTANDGSHTWLLPADLIPGADYTVQVYSATDFTAIDTSDTAFTIAGY